MNIEKIDIIRGDTVCLETDIISSETLSLSNFNSITFSLKKTTRKDSPILIQINKEDMILENNKLSLTISETETAKLDLGEYFAEIEFVLSDGYTKTKRLKINVDWDLGE